MKKTLLFCCLISALFCRAQIKSIPLPSTKTETLSSRQDSVFSIRLAELPVEKISAHDQWFTHLSLPGFTYTGAPGDPRLPAQIHRLNLSADEDIEIYILDSAYIDIDLRAMGFADELIPVQFPRRKDKGGPPAWVQNKAAYRQRKFTEQPLANIEMLGLAGERKWVQVNILPFKYLPSRHLLRVYYRLDIGYRVIRKASSKAIPEKQNTAEVYQIVSPQKYLNALAPFIRWKSEKGFSVEVVVSDQAPINGNREELYQTLSRRYHSHLGNKPKYLLLVGDTDDIAPYPTTFDDSHWLVGSATGRYITDFYYAEYTGDLLPDVRYGRFSARNESEVSTQVDKTLRMEQLGSHEGHFLQNTTLIAGWESNNQLVALLNATLQYMSDLYFSNSERISPKIYWSPNSSSAASQVMQDINTGCGFINYTAHGNWNEWSSPRLDLTHIAQMNNAGTYPFMIGNCCLTNKFEKDACFGESLLRKRGGGAVAYIGASNYTYFEEDLQWAIGGTTPNSAAYTYASTGLGVYDRFFHQHGETHNEWVQTAGDFVFYGNLAVQTSQANNGEEMKKYYWEVYHLMGDPSYVPPIGLPSQMNPSFPKKIDKNIPVISFQLPPHAYLGISQDGHRLFGGRSNADGKIDYQPTTLQAGSALKIIVSAQNYWVYIDSIEVETLHDAIVRIADIEIDKLPKNTLDFGKKQSLRIQIENPSSSLAHSIRLRLQSKNPWVRVLNPEVYIDSLQPQQRLWLEQEIEVVTQAGVRDQENLDFQFHFSHNDSLDFFWSFHLNARAPNLTVLLRSESEKDARQVKLHLALQNQGSVGLDSAGIHLRVLRPDVLSSLNTLLSLDSSDEKTLIFPMSWESDSPLWMDFPLVVRWEKGDFQKEDTLHWVHTYETETFESEAFTHSLWELPSSWLRVEGGAFGSAYSLKSPPISHSASSSIFTRYAQYSGKDSLLFDYRVSSETCGGYCGDGLFFRIHAKNNEGGASTVVREEFFSGLGGWTSASYALPGAGLYAFEWSYAKDESASSGYDAAWIDNVRFPARTYFDPTTIRTRENSSSSNFWAHFDSRDLCLDIVCTEAQNGEILLFRSDGQMICRYPLSLEQGKHRLRKSPGVLAPGLYICTYRVGDQQVSVKLTY